MPMTRNQASFTNEGEENTLQRLLRVVASLQARSDEQSRLSAEAEQRHRQGQPFSEEIDETPIPPNFREVVVEPFDGTQDPHTHLQDFQTQMYISGENDRLSCKLFPGILRGVAMQWMVTLPARTIKTFNDLVSTFVSQFAANKGLRAGPFSDSLALERLVSMEEIHARAEKHVEAEEDQTGRLEEERAGGRRDASRAPHQELGHKSNLQTRAKDPKHFTPLIEKRAWILKEICHTSLLNFPPISRGRIMGNSRKDWCEFHHITGHSTKGCWTLKTQIEKLVQEGQLN
ncbi:hypothetical protein CR513_57959, partial [Mucuna pruriens]